MYELFQNILSLDYEIDKIIKNYFFTFLIIFYTYNKITVIWIYNIMFNCFQTFERYYTIHWA